MKLQFQVQKAMTDDSISITRVKMIKSYESGSFNKPLCTMCSISTSDMGDEKKQTNHKYLIASAVTSASSDSKPGLLPLAELAIKLSKNGSPIPNNSGKVFCFSTTST